MKKRVVKIALISAFVIVQMVSFCFAKEMIKAGDTFYLIDDNSDICKNELYFDGKYSRYFGEDGKMVVGWYTNIKTGDTYYFDKTEGEKYGTMVAGICEIDGCKRIFCTDGSGANGSLIKGKTNYKAIDGNVYNIDDNGYVYDLNGNLLGDTAKRINVATIDKERKKVDEDSKQILEEVMHRDKDSMSPIREKLSEYKGIVISKKIK